MSKEAKQIICKKPEINVRFH